MSSKTTPDGTLLCIVFRTGRRVRHWHLPKAGIVRCGTTAEAVRWWGTRDTPATPEQPDERSA